MKIKLEIFILVFFCIFNNQCSKNVDIFENSKFKNSLNLPKTKETRSFNQLEDLYKISTTKDSLIVNGDGYSGYQFLIFHKPLEKGNLFIKAFEMTTNTPLSVEENLKEKTTIKIDSISNKTKMFKRTATIYEGTMGKFYPARFELWFKSKKKEIKLLDKEYMIDGWDR